MFHFIDGFIVFNFAEAFHAPVFEHACMQKILIDRGEFVLQRLVQKFQYFRIALHGGPLWIARESVEV
jgi:hypothetical protein